MSSDELRERLRALDAQIAAWDRWTDKHPNPHGMDKLRRLTADRDQLIRALAEVRTDDDHTR